MNDIIVRNELFSMLPNLLSFTLFYVQKCKRLFKKQIYFQELAQYLQHKDEKLIQQSEIMTLETRAMRLQELKELCLGMG